MFHKLFDPHIVLPEQPSPDANDPDMPDAYLKIEFIDFNGTLKERSEFN